MCVLIEVNWRRAGVAVLAVVAAAGVAACGSDEGAGRSDDSTRPTEQTDASSLPTVSTPDTSTPDPTTPDATTPNTTTPGEPPTPAVAVVTDGVQPIGTTMQRLIDAAAVDLTQRFTIDGDTPIIVTEANEVTWPDASLGCPAKGMQYAQVLTPGVQIVLEHDGRSYAYHAGSVGVPTYCPRPQPPLAE